jgi:hypothetical protein
LLILREKTFGESRPVDFSLLSLILKAPTPTTRIKKPGSIPEARQAALKWNDKSTAIRGLHPAFVETAAITRVSRRNTRGLFNSFLETEDTSFLIGGNPLAAARARTASARSFRNFPPLDTTRFAIHRASSIPQGPTRGVWC